MDLLPPLQNLLDPLRQFLAVGGLALWSILIATVVLGALIIERYIFLRTSYPALVTALVDRWQARSERYSWHARQLRRMEIAEADYELRRSLPLIRSLTIVLPILGLLGTVNGMISTFTVMQLFGTGNVNGVANGISEALVTTMAGLVCALPGLYFSTSLPQRTRAEIRKLTALLELDDEFGNPGLLWVRTQVEARQRIGLLGKMLRMLR